jgi:glycosyltransferase involved in cell wall biosynthesis
MKSPGVSIVICCHNGANRLAQTVRHIAMQRVPAGIPWEVILIDNGSTDQSAQVARDEWQRYRVESCLRVIPEPTMGLSFARARGFQEAHYAYIILCDDDNWLDENYVANAFRICSENNNIGALGGFGKLLFEGCPPSMELSYIFASGPQAPRSGKVPENRVYGAGCVIRHSAYEKLLKSGFKSLLTDRKGAELSSGGDHELCYALAILGYDIWYDESLRFTHFITRERLAWEYFLRYARESSKCFNVLSSYKAIASNTHIHWLPGIALIRNFVACSKFLLVISFRRLRAGSNAQRTSLFFRHLLFTNYWLAYFRRFSQMVETHRQILAFREQCRPLQHTLRPIQRKVVMPSFKLSFFSKPWRPLQ